MEPIRMDDRLTRPMPTSDPLRKQGDGQGSIRVLRERFCRKDGFLPGMEFLPARV